MRERGALPGDKTNPRLEAGSSISAEWNLPTVAAPLEEARAMVDPAAYRQEPMATRHTGPIARIVHANPIATFAAGFIVGTGLMIILWSVL